MRPHVRADISNLELMGGKYPSWAYADGGGGWRVGTCVRFGVESESRVGSGSRPQAPRAVLLFFRLPLIAKAHTVKLPVSVRVHS